MNSWSWPPATTTNSAYGNFPSRTISGTDVVDPSANMNKAFMPRPEVDLNCGENNTMTCTTNPQLNCNNCHSPTVEYLHGEEAMAALNKYLPNYQQQFYPDYNIDPNLTVGQLGSGENGEMLTPPPLQEIEIEKKIPETKTVAFECNGNSDKRQYRSKSQGVRQPQPGNFEMERRRGQGQGHPSILKRNPSTPQMSQKLSVSETKRMSQNKPKFHLCGKCTKCKIIQGNSPMSPSDRGSSISLPKGYERGYSTTIFPR